MEMIDEDALRAKLGQLDNLKFTSTRVTRKRKQNPVEVKYEEKPEPNKDPKIDKNNKKNFYYIWERMKEMRKDFDAPVDGFGCDKSLDDGAPKETRDFQLLCSLLISVQNRDESTAAAVERLKKHGLTVDNVNEWPEEKILGIIGGVNFNKTKAKNIKRAAQIMTEKYNKRVPDKLEDLLDFPGVGNKIAILFLNTAYKLNVGIGVDTHVHRIADRLGWAHKAKKPDDTRLEMQSFVPKEFWSEINYIMVGFGQQICLPANPKCHVCLLNKVCPEGRKNMRYRKDNLTKIEETTEVQYTKKVKLNEKDDINVKEEDGVKKEEKIEIKLIRRGDKVTKYYKGLPWKEEESKIEVKMEEEGVKVKEEYIEKDKILEEIVKIEETETPIGDGKEEESRRYKVKLRKRQYKD